MFDPRKRGLYELFTQQGWSPVQASAIIGGGIQESGPDLNTTALGDHGTAYGGWQWRGKRRAGLKDFAAGQGAELSDLMTQGQFVNHELHNNEAKYGDALARAADPMSASKAFISYERPRGWTEQNPKAGDGFVNRFHNTLDVLRDQGGYAPNARIDMNAGAQGRLADMLAMRSTLPTPDNSLGRLFIADAGY